MPGGAKFKTIDEESSGVIEITSLLSKHPSDRGRFGNLGLMTDDAGH